MAKRTPLVRGNTLTYQQDGQEQVLQVDTPAWYSWLETASSFTFSNEEGSFTARKERAGNRRGGWYWKAYRRRSGKLTTFYLGKSNTITHARLQTVSQALADALVEASPGKMVAAAVEPSQAAAPGIQGDLPSPLLATKLHRPVPRPRLVGRPHLTERLTQGIRGPLTLVSAPAGFGKTTLLAQWLSECDMPVAWLSLEPQDNEPARFLSYLIAALQTLDPRLGGTAFSLLQAPQPTASETVLTLLTNDIMSHKRDVGDFVLVLDDYHVIEALPIHHTLLFLLEHLPPRMHLVLLTRSDPPLPLSRLRARGQLTELRAAEMRFSIDEVSAFLQIVMGLDLPSEAIATLQSRTEGWIAGLQFAALSLRGRTDVSTFLAAFTGSHHFVLDYLSEEVLSRQPSSVQRFLLYTSVLERLSGPLCDAVTEQKSSQTMLETLDHANLFVVSLDDERRWYRFHHLFAEVLRNRLQQAEPTLVSELHCRASAWYEQHEMLVEAVQHALAAPDLERAARLIEQYGIPFAIRGGVHTVLGWLNALPDKMVRTHPRLCLYSALMLMFTNQLEAAELRLHDAEACVQIDKSTDFARSILGWVAAVRGNLALFYGDLARCVALAQQTLALVPETEVLMRAAAATGPAHAFLVSGDVSQEVEEQVAATTSPVRATGDLFAFLTSITLLAQLQVLQGRLRQATATYEGVIQVVPEQQMLRALVGAAGYYFGLGDLLREWNDLDNAKQFLEQGMELVAGSLTVAAHVVTQGYTATARLLQACGDYRGALATLAAFFQLARQRRFVPQLSAHASAVQAQLELAQDNLTAAILWANASGLSARDDPSYPREREYLTLARVLIAQGRHDPTSPFLHDAQFLLERLLADAESNSRGGSIIEILILRALVLHAQDERIDALKTLERALVLAEPESYIRLFVDEGPSMLALLHQAYTHGMVNDYIATLLAAFGERPTAVHPLRSSHHGLLVEPLTEREREVLRLLIAGLSNASIAQELVITVGTVKRHVNSLYGKLGVNSRTQAIVRAQSLHLL